MVAASFKPEADGKRYEENKATMKEKKGEATTGEGGDGKNVLPDTIILSSGFQSIGMKKVLIILKHFATLLLFSVTLLPLRIFILVSMITLQMIYNATSSQNVEQPVHKPVTKPVKKLVVEAKSSPTRRRVRKSTSADDLSSTDSTKVSPIRRRDYRFKKPTTMKKPNKIKQEEDDVNDKKRRVKYHNNATLQPSQRCRSRSTSVSSNSSWTPEREPSPISVKVYSSAASSSSDSDTLSTTSSKEPLYRKPSYKRKLRTSLSLSRKRIKQILTPRKRTKQKRIPRTYAHDDDLYNYSFRGPMPSTGPTRPQRTPSFTSDDDLYNNSIRVPMPSAGPARSLSFTSESMTSVSRPIEPKPQAQQRQRRRSSSLSILPSSQHVSENSSSSSTYGSTDDVNSSTVFFPTSSKFTPVAEVKHRCSQLRPVVLFVYHSWCFSILLMLPAFIHLLLGVKNISEYEKLVLENWRSVPPAHQLCEEMQEVFQVWRESLYSSITDQLWKGVSDYKTLNLKTSKQKSEPSASTSIRLKFLQSPFIMAHSCIHYIFKMLLAHSYTRWLVYLLYPLYACVRNFSSLVRTIVNLLCLMLIHLFVLVTSQICFLLSIPRLCFNTAYLFACKINSILYRLFCIRKNGKSRGKDKTSSGDGKEQLEVKEEAEEVKESLQSMYKSWSQKEEKSASATNTLLEDHLLEKLKNKKEVPVSVLKPFEFDSSDSYSDWDTFSSTRSSFSRNRTRNSKTSSVQPDSSTDQHKQLERDDYVKELINKIKEDKVKQIEEKLTLKKGLFT